MVLVKGNVGDVCTALHLSRVIFRRIQWNLLWSLLYNCLGIPIAAGAFYPLVHTRLPPTIAALAMALSSISVVTSSLSLRLYRPPDLRAEQQRRRRRQRNRRSRGTTSSGSNNSSSAHGLTSAWSRWRRRQQGNSQSASSVDDVNDDSTTLVANLLQNDHLVALGSNDNNDLTESTRCVDNRTDSRLEAVGSDLDRYDDPEG